VSGEVGGLGVSVGRESSSSSSQGGGSSVTFPYDPVEGGDSQMVVAIYLVRVYITIDTYEVHWSQGLGANYTFESNGETREEASFLGYDSIGM
jgi:hypothetical protein